MLTCVCGFTCGTRKALQRHFDKFADTDQAEKHMQLLDLEENKPNAKFHSANGFSSTSASFFGRRSYTPRGLEDEETAASPPSSTNSPTGSTAFITPRTPARQPLPEQRTSSHSSTSKRRSTAAMHEPPILPEISPSASSTSVKRLNFGIGRSQSHGATVSGFGMRHSPSLLSAGNSAVSGLVGLPSTAEEGVVMRLLLVRHAQSANKCKDSRRGAAKEADPELSMMGYDQAEALGRRLAKEFSNGDRRLLVVSSPMRRCLLTIQPAVSNLKLPAGSVFCHGRCYEYGCAGQEHAGSTAEDVREGFPEFETVGFNASGTWDYRGDSPKENEEECRERCAGIVAWLQIEALRLFEAVPGYSGSIPTVVLCSHQTISDLLCQILVDGTDKHWSYGEIKYGLHNTGITELFLHPDGCASFGFRDDNYHAEGIMRRRMSCP